MISKEKLGVGCTDISPLEKKYVNDVLKTGRLSYGPYSQRLEKEFAKVHGCEFSVFCNSGTSALQVALAALKEREGWRDGYQILVPAVTFVATSNIVLQNNMTPVFVDVDPINYNINPVKIKEKINHLTRAIIVAHLFGLPCDMEPIMEIARKHNLRVIEDSCETMFVKYKGKPVGSFGDVACFSTYVAHLMVTGVGGFVTTNSPGIANITRSLINHGRDPVYFSIDDSKNKTNVIKSRFKFIRVGYSYRATEMEAALGLGQLQRRDVILKKRLINAFRLNRGLRNIPFLRLPVMPLNRDHAFMMYPIVLNIPVKNKLISFLERNGIETRDMLPLINQPIYKTLFGEIENEYPVAQYINSHGFYIGCHQKLSKENINYIIDCFFKFFKLKR